MVEAFEEAESRGVASLRVDGRFVDYPIYYLARRKLTRFEAYRDAEGAGHERPSRFRSRGSASSTPRRCSRGR